MTTAKLAAHAARGLTITLLHVAGPCVLHAQVLPLDSVVEHGYSRDVVIEIPARKVLVGERLRGVRSIVNAQNVLALGFQTGPHAAHVALYDLKRRLGPIVLEGTASFDALWGLNVDQNGRDIWVFDPQRRALTRVVVQSEREDTRAVYSLPVQLDPGAALFTAFARGNEIWAAGILSRGRVVRFDSVGKLIGLLGPSPPSDGLDPMLASQVYRGVLAKKPTGALAVIACRLAGRVEIIDSTGASVRLADVPHAFPPQPRFQEVEGTKLARNRADRLLGYIDVHATDRYIYALFSGRVRTQAGDRGANGRFVHVFDWSGQRIAVLKLPYDARTLFATDDDRQLFFAHSLEGEHYVAVGDLPDKLRNRRTEN